MKLGVHKESLAASLEGADLMFVYRSADMDVQFDADLAPLGSRLTICTNYDQLVSGLAGILLAGDQLVFMSNGGFGAARQKLTMELQNRRLSDA